MLLDNTARGSTSIDGDHEVFSRGNFGKEVIFVSEDAVPERLKGPGYQSTSIKVAVSCSVAMIVLPLGENIDVQGIVHELLHIHRYWVEGVPRIFPTSVTMKICWST